MICRSYALDFSLPDFFWITEVFPHEIFRHCEANTYHQKIVNHLIIRKFFRYPIFFWNTEGLPYDFFRDCETQTLTKNRDTHPSSLIQKPFQYPKFSETRKGSPTTVLGTVRQKRWQKIVIHQLLLLSIKNFDTRNFWKTDVFPYETFALRGTKNY